MYFNKPTQLMFWDSDSGTYLGGIGYRDEIICGCCGGVFEASEIIHDAVNDEVVPFLELAWVDINEAIGAV